MVGNSALKLNSEHGSDVSQSPSEGGSDDERAPSTNAMVLTAAEASEEAQRRGLVA